MIPCKCPGTSAGNAIPEILFEILRRAPGRTPRWTSRRGPRVRPRRASRGSPGGRPLGRRPCGTVGLVVVAVEVVIVVVLLIDVVRWDGWGPAMSHFNSSKKMWPKIWTDRNSDPNFTIVIRMKNNDIQGHPSKGLPSDIPFVGHLLRLFIHAIAPSELSQRRSWSVTGLHAYMNVKFSIFHLKTGMQTKSQSSGMLFTGVTITWKALCSLFLLPCLFKTAEKETLGQEGRKESPFPLYVIP